MSLAPWVATGVMSEDTPSPLVVALRLLDLYGAVHVEEATLHPGHKSEEVLSSETRKKKTSDRSRIDAVVLRKQKSTGSGKALPYNG